MTELDTTTDHPTTGQAPRAPAEGTIGQLKYAVAYFRSLEPTVRRKRLANWVVKPGLAGRATRFAFPQYKKGVPSAGFGRRQLLPAPTPHYSNASSWREVRQDNLDEVVEIMTAAGIDHVVIDDSIPTRAQVAIDVEDVARWIEEFERRGKHGLILAARPWTDSVRLQIGSQDNLMQRVMRRRVSAGESLIAFRYRRLAGSERVLDLAFGTVISAWKRHETEDRGVFVRSSAPNRWAQSLPVDPARGVTQSTVDIVRAEITGRRHVDDIDVPIDLVFLWVDGDDPEWMERRNARLEEVGGEPESQLTDEAAEARLYRSRDELRYALRSVQTWAPFINHVYLVTDRQVPAWFREFDGLTIVDHTEILPSEALPTFNSNAIDTGLHRIPGLSEHFLVTNDDMMFIGPSFAEDFFSPGGVPRIFLSKAQIPLGDETKSATAVDSAGRRNRELIADRHGVTITQKFKHIMIPQTRSLRLEVEELYGAAVRATALRPFRDHGDVAFSHLCLYEALATGRAVIGSLPYDYVSLGSARMAQALSEIRSSPGRLKVLCLNDSDVELVLDEFGEPIGEIAVNQHERDAVVSEFLESVFPAPSSWEMAQASTTQNSNKEISR